MPETTLNKKRNWLPQAIVLICAAVMPVALLGLDARAADADTSKHEIKLNAHEGDRWDFDMTQKKSTKMDVTIAGQPRTVTQALSTRRKGTLEVLAVKDGEPTKVKVTFDKDSTTSTNNNGKASDGPFPLAGKTITVTRDNDGKVTTDAEGIDANTAQEVTGILDADTSIFPPHPVKVGEEWPADDAVLARQLHLGKGDNVSLKCKLLAIGKVAGRATADIFAAGSVTKHEQGIVFRTDLSGITQVDLATGQTLQSDLIGKIAVKGSGDVLGPDGQTVAMQAVGEGTLEEHQTVHPPDAANPADNPLDPGGSKKPGNPLDVPG